MRDSIFYFAYGSNMNPHRMADRLPFARRIGTGYVIGWEVKERLYANLEPKSGKRAEGVVYVLNESEVRTLDRYEGFPTVYTCKRVKVWLNDGFKNGSGTSVPAMTYIMTDETLKERFDKPYPSDYREICSIGARYSHIRDVFTERKPRVA